MPATERAQVLSGSGQRQITSSRVLKQELQIQRLHDITLCEHAHDALPIVGCAVKCRV